VIFEGRTGTFFIGSNRIEGKISKLKEKLDPKTGHQIKKNRVRLLNSNMAAIVEVTLEHPVCAEVFTNFAS